MSQTNRLSSATTQNSTTTEGDGSQKMSVSIPASVTADVLTGHVVNLQFTSVVIEMPPMRSKRQPVAVMRALPPIAGGAPLVKIESEIAPASRRERKAGTSSQSANTRRRVVVAKSQSALLGYELLASHVHPVMFVFSSVPLERRT
jgi:hypothetical protein